MALLFECPICSAELEVEDHYAGGLVACYKCTNTIMVPAQGVREGMRIGNYVLDEQIGTGKLGEVWSAHMASKPDFTYAIRILPQALSANKGIVDKFMKSFDNTSRINHPDIVTAFDMGSQHGLHYIVSPYVHGETLEELLERDHVLPEKVALGIVLRVANALTYAWDIFKLTHSNIKPGNIMLTDNGDVKLMDLGIAVSAADDVSLSQMGIVIGDPHYMSPEQANVEQNLDFRSDIYSLGVVLFQMVSGSVPFDASSAFGILGKQVNEPVPSPRKFNPRVTEQCEVLLRRMMSKKRENRPENWSEMAKEIELVRNGEFPKIKLSRKAEEEDNVESRVLDRRKIIEDTPKASPTKKKIKRHKKPTKATKNKAKTSVGRRNSKDSANTKKESNSKAIIVIAVMAVFMVLFLAGSIVVYRNMQKQNRIAEEKQRQLQLELTRAKNAEKMRQMELSQAKTVAPLSSQAPPTGLEDPRHMKRTVQAPRPAPTQASPAASATTQNTSLVNDESSRWKRENAARCQATAPILAKILPQLNQLFVNARNNNGATDIVICAPTATDSARGIKEVAGSLKSNMVVQLQPGTYPALELSLSGEKNLVFTGTGEVRIGQVRLFGSGSCVLRNVNMNQLEIGTNCVIVDSSFNQVNVKDGDTIIDKSHIRRLIVGGSAKVYVTNSSIKNPIDDEEPGLFCSGGAKINVVDTLISSAKGPAIGLNSSFNGSLVMKNVKTSTLPYAACEYETGMLGRVVGKEFPTIDDLLQSQRVTIIPN